MTLTASRDPIVNRTDALRSMFGGASAPSTAVLHQMFFNETDGKIYICTNETGPVFTEFTTYLMSVMTNVVGRSNLANGAATSVIGRSANSTGAVADIAAASDDVIFRRTGGALNFGALTIGMFADDLITFAKLPNVATNTLLGRFNSGTGDIESIGLNSDLAFSGGNLRVVAYTGDVTKTAGGTALSIASGVITSTHLSSSLLDTDASMAANSNTRVPSQAAVVSYVNNMLLGLRWKNPVRAATSAAGTLASSFQNGSTIDGVVLATNDRILIKNQAAATENGIYTVNASGAPTRATDADAGSELVNATVMVQEGTLYADTQWTCTNNTAPTLGSTNITFAQVAAAGASYAGDTTTITLSGNTFSITTNGVDNTQLRQSVGVSVIGRSANSTGNVADITASADDRFLARTGGALSFTQLTNGMVPQNTIGADKMNFTTTDKLLGRDTAGGGAGQEIGVTGGIVFDGSNNIQTTAFTGDVTKALGGTALTIANDAVTYAKMQNVSAQWRLLGRVSSGAGDVEEININSLTEDTAPAPAADFVLSYDATDGSLKKVLHRNVKPIETITIAVGDETTTITTGVAKVTFRMPYAFTITAVRASLNTVSSSGIPTFDINEGGVSILSTKLTIDASEKTSTTAATAAVLSDTSLADDAEMTIDIDVAGTGAKGPKVQIIGYRT